MRYLTDEQVRTASAITSVLEMVRADKMDARIDAVLDDGAAS